MLTKLTVKTCYHIFTRQENLLPLIRSDVILNCLLFSQTESPDCANSQPDLNNKSLKVKTLDGVQPTKPPLAHFSGLPALDLNNKPVSVPAMTDLASSSFSRAEKIF